MSTTLYTPVDGAIGLQLASGYTAGSGSMILKAGQGAFFVTFPTIVTAITQGTYNTGGGETLCEYVVTGKSTDTLTGVTAVGGFTDRNFATNDYVEGRVSAVYIANLNAVATPDAGTITANFVKAGPTTGAAAVPTYRLAVPADLPVPLYPNFTYDTTNTCPQWTPIADPATPAVGDRWLSTASNSPVDCRLAGFNVREDGTFFSCGSCTQLASFTSTASLLQSPTNTLGSLTIPANTLKINQIIEIAFLASYQCTTGAPTFTFYIYMGTTQILVTAAQLISAGALGPFAMGTNNGPISLMVTSIGSSGGMTGSGNPQSQNATTNTNGYVFLSAGSNGYGPVTVNTTTSQALDFRCACSASSALNNIQILNCQMRIRG